MSYPHYLSSSPRGPPSPSPLFIPRQTNAEGQRIPKQPEDNDLSGKTLVNRGFLSSTSSQVSIHSPTDPSPDEPSPVLAGLGIYCNAISPLTEHISTAHLPRVGKEPSAQPRREYACKSPRQHKSRAPSMEELKDRPLPPLPLETSHSYSKSAGNRTQLPRTKEQESPYGSYQRRAKHYALPTKPQQKHFDAIDRALERAKQEQRWVDLRPVARSEGALQERRVRKVNPGARIRSQIAIPESVDEDIQLQPLLQGESPVSGHARSVDSETHEKIQNTVEKVEENKSAEKKPPCVGHKQPTFLYRAVQWLRPSWSRERRRLPAHLPVPKKQPNSTSQAEPQMPVPLTTPSFLPAQPPPAEPTSRKPRLHRDSVTRMKRVLSALMDERISLCLSNQSNAEDEQALTQLLQRTQQQLLQGLRDMPRSRDRGAETPFVQSTTVSPIASVPSLPIHPPQRRSTHELDSKPLPDRKSVV